MALLPARPGAAAPLSPEACAAVETEHAALAASGIPEIVKSGPAGGGDPLTSAKAKEVARYIHLREQFLFRCGHDKKRANPAAVEGEGAVAAGAEKAVVPPPPKRKPAPARPTAQAAKPAAGAPAKAGTTPATAKPAQKPKAKPDDAYRPPPKEPLKSP